MLTTRIDCYRGSVRQYQIHDSIRLTRFPSIDSTPANELPIPIEAYLPFDSLSIHRIIFNLSAAHHAKGETQPAQTAVWAPTP